MDIPKAIENNPNHENFEARCPTCLQLNIFNRASDIKSSRLITGQVVVCQNDKCKKEFWIGGDLVNPAWQMVIRDCWMLKPQKRYAYCILNLCQAYEMYFSLCLRVMLIYKPYNVASTHDLAGQNELSRMLYEKIKGWTYLSLRNALMHLIIDDVQCQNLLQCQNAINNLVSNDPSDELLRTIKDKKLSDALLDLKNNTIHVFRNQVVHKNGYRPTLEEVEKAEEDTRMLYKLDHCLYLLGIQTAAYDTSL